MEMLVFQQPSSESLSSQQQVGSIECVVTQPAPVPVRPRDHLAVSIYVLICCCWPLGLLAVYCSVKVSRLHMSVDVAYSIQVIRRLVFPHVLAAYCNYCSILVRIYI